jgi:hypothetical protein
MYTMIILVYVRANHSIHCHSRILGGKNGRKTFVILTGYVNSHSSLLSIILYHILKSVTICLNEKCFVFYF